MGGEKVPTGSRNLGKIRKNRWGGMWERKDLKWFETRI